MSYGHSIRFLSETVRTLAFGSIPAAGTYAGIGTTVDHPARMLLIQNFTDAMIMFSLDGIEPNFPLIESSHFVLDIAANQTGENGFFLAEGDRLYATRVGVPTLGAVYFTAFYGKD